MNQLKIAWKLVLLAELQKEPISPFNHESWNVQAEFKRVINTFYPSALLHSVQRCNSSYTCYVIISEACGNDFHKRNVPILITLVAMVSITTQFVIKLHCDGTHYHTVSEIITADGANNNFQKNF